MPAVIEKPSQLFTSIAATLRNPPLGISVGSREDFTDVGDQPWVLITLERDAADCRGRDGRIAHVLISRRTPKLFPMTLTLLATAAPFSVADETGFKLRRSISYGPTTLGALLRL